MSLRSLGRGRWMFRGFAEVLLRLLGCCMGWAYGVTTTEVAAVLPMARSHLHLHDLRHSAAQETALHMITMAARALLMIGTAILVGEAVAGPGKKLLEGRLHRPMVSNEDGEPAD